MILMGQRFALLTSAHQSNWGFRCEDAVAMDDSLISDPSMESKDPEAHPTLTARTNSRGSRAGSAKPAPKPKTQIGGWNKLKLAVTQPAATESMDSAISAKSGDKGVEAASAASGSRGGTGRTGTQRSKEASQRNSARSKRPDAVDAEPSVATTATATGKPKLKPRPPPPAEPAPQVGFLAKLKKRFAAARDELIESDNMKDRLFGAVTQLLAKETEQHVAEVKPPPDDPFYVKMDHTQRAQRWYDVWWAASRAPRRRQFAATRIQNLWALYVVVVPAWCCFTAFHAQLLLRILMSCCRCDHRCRFLEKTYQRQKASALYIEAAFQRYLYRRQTRAYWANFPVSVRCRPNFKLFGRMKKPPSPRFLTTRAACMCITLSENPTCASGVHLEAARPPRVRATCSPGARLSRVPGGAGYPE